MSGRGGFRKRRGGPQPPFRGVKKPKRSKKFWQQRQTMEVAPVPDQEQQEDDKDETSEEEEEEATSYDKLLNVFGAKETSQNVLSDDEDDSEEAQLDSLARQYCQSVEVRSGL